MQFRDNTITYDDGSKYENWISGVYKIVAYDHTDEITRTEGKVYRAYVAIEALKPDGDPGHVMNRRLSEKLQTSFNAAEQLCVTHALLSA